MAELRWIKMSLFLILVLHFIAASGQSILYTALRAGDDVTLSCEIVMDDHNNCGSIAWIYTDITRTAAVRLVHRGQIDKQAKDKSDRLSVTGNCSLVINKVTEEDVGQYDCRLAGPGQPAGLDAAVILSVVKMTEHNNTDEVTFECSVSTYERCRLKVKWLYRGQDVDKDNKDIITSQSPCSASVTFLTSQYIYTSRYNSLRCEVTAGDKSQVFLFRPSSSDEDTTTISTEPRTEISTTAGWWRVIIVSVGLAALIIVVVVVNMWSRTKEKKTQTDEITVCYDADDDTVNYENTRSPDGV